IYSRRLSSSNGSVAFVPPFTPSPQLYIHNVYVRSSTHTYLDAGSSEAVPDGRLLETPRSIMSCAAFDSGTITRVYGRNDALPRLPSSSGRFSREGVCGPVSGIILYYELST
ncbi:hypothetical protein Trydic_g10076, partial [Trypoxylus dichotomus]